MSHESQEHLHIVKYKTHFRVLIALITFTFLSIAVTHFDVGNLAVTAALILASIKSGLVLWHFMHLKYENRIIIGMVAVVLFLFVAVMIVTFLDYDFR